MNKIKIKLVVGLGNPGKEYENTRHNAGFLFIDELENYLKNKNSKLKIIIAKSEKFMNQSGRAIAALTKLHKIKPENILIVHDDIDILFGKYKFSFGRSSAGHKGAESIIKSLKTKGFWRLRIGIQPKRELKIKNKELRIKADKIILKKFTSAELKTLNTTIKKAVSELEIALD